MKHGFTLLELSIVLVIIGLIIGGITVGADMIRSAELNSVVSDVNKYQTAVNTFKLKYNGLPGDIKNATAYWGAQAGGSANGVDSTCQALDNNNPATSEATCNGDGNGKIGLYTNLAAPSQAEVFRAWQHLANAEIIAGSYSGVTDSTINNYTSGPVTTMGWNIPASRITGAGYMLNYWGAQVATLHFFAGNYGHVLMFGTSACSTSPIYHCYPLGKVISPAEAMLIDQKMDDGAPGRGRVMTPLPSANPNCASSSDEQNAEYSLSETDKKCGLIFKIGR